MTWICSQILFLYHTSGIGMAVSIFSPQWKIPEYSWTHTFRVQHLLIAVSIETRMLDHVVLLSTVLIYVTWTAGVSEWVSETRASAERTVCTYTKHSCTHCTRYSIRLIFIRVHRLSNQSKCTDFRNVMLCEHVYRYICAKCAGTQCSQIWPANSDINYSLHFFIYLDLMACFGFGRFHPSSCDLI